MHRISVTTLLLLTITACLQAQTGTGESDIARVADTVTHNTRHAISVLPLSLDLHIGYEHSQINSSAFTSAILLNYTPQDWVKTNIGFRVSTHSMYSFAARGDFNWRPGNKRSCLTLRNQYNYNIYGASNFQDLNISLAAAYDHPYFYIAAGGYARMFTNIKPPRGSRRTTIWEPGLVYDIEGRIFPKQHVWNIGLQITNMRLFVIERFYAPNFILKGNYRINGYADEHLNLQVQTGFQPAGLMHIAVNYYTFFLNVGITCAI
ncbi:MAG: hypothetical protein ACI3Z7_01690 [Candidatus Aphodosoma sp.]